MSARAETVNHIWGADILRRIEYGAVEVWASTHSRIQWPQGNSTRSCARGHNSQTTIYDTCHSPPFSSSKFCSAISLSRRGAEEPGIAQNAREEKKRKDAHSGRIRYVMLHNTLVLHIVDHSPLIGTNNEISELSVEKRETSVREDLLLGRKTNTWLMETGWWTTVVGSGERSDCERAMRE